MDKTIRTAKRAACAAAVVLALALSLSVGTASAAPLKNADRVCTKLGGTFVGSEVQYTCSGVDSTLAFSFLASPMRQCLHSFKGIWSFEVLDWATGAWRYTCDLS